MITKKELKTAIMWSYYAGLNNTDERTFKEWVKKEGWK